MSWTRHVRTWHRRLSIVIGVQLLLWTASGFIFTWDHIDVVRGDVFVVERTSPGLPVDLTAKPPASRPAGTAGLRLAWLRGQWTWAAIDHDGGSLGVFDAGTGAPLPELDAAAATALAQAAVVEPWTALDTTRITQTGGEYSKRPVPAWRVDFDHPEHLSLYIDATTGAVAAVRTDIWRRFDWFWMLHIMDYDERTDFHHPLLRVAAGLGVVTSFTGIWLAIALLWPWRGRRTS